ncbi:DUF6227 family protein [Streptomyces sp. NPDC060194]|uniref:DUF6227 family protein n=1 Tax=Streptomyces sp. NPDC060194 TaxID=3347069 RepID=UPI003660AF9E
MSDPYDTPVPGTTGAGDTPEEHLNRLLGRALNSFDLPDETVARLDTALTYDVSLHSSRHGSGLHRETYRHSLLLGDGSVVTLWELVHNASADGRPQCEVYTEEEEVRVAASRLPLPAGGLDEVAGGLEFDLLAVVPLGTAMEDRPREYRSDDSADHARRLLRRAENPDRPGEDAALALREAVAHEIVQAFGRPASYALYEHAFLLRDGREVSLWEVEHTATPDGRHMCEVYGSEAAAHAAMERRARVM